MKLINKSSETYKGAAISIESYWNSEGGITAEARNIDIPISRILIDKSDIEDPENAVIGLENLIRVAELGAIQSAKYLIDNRNIAADIATLEPWRSITGDGMKLI